MIFTKKHITWAWLWGQKFPENRRLITKHLNNIREKIEAHKKLENERQS